MLFEEIVSELQRAVMGLLRMIKLFAWEGRISERLREKREDELDWIRKWRLLNLINMNLKYVLDCCESWPNSSSYIIPLITMLVTYSTYTLVFKNVLSGAYF